MKYIILVAVFCVIGIFAQNTETNNNTRELNSTQYFVVDMTIKIIMSIRILVMQDLEK